MASEEVTQNGRAELQIGTETVTFNRSIAPPPYTLHPTEDLGRVITTDSQIIHQTIIVQPSLKSNPIAYNCPSCKERVITRVEFRNTRKTHMMAGFICGLTFWCMMCCLATVPYLVPTFKQAVHFCPNCKIYLGSYSKI